LRGPFCDLPAIEQMQMIQLNINSLTELTHALLPGMLKREFGGVLNVASTAAFQPGPWMAAYYASKAYVLSFSEALHEELLDSPLHITALCPGPTKTGFSQRAGMGDTLLFSHGVMDAATVARFGFEAFQQGRAVAVPGLKNRLLAISTRLGPRMLVRKIVKRLQS
ncbi:MAG: SDR family NAD(P)-dependent oxidoreductase, partial [Mariprofundus sp.]